KALVPGSSSGGPNRTTRPPPDFSSSSSYDATVPPTFHHVRSEIGPLLNKKMETALIDPGQARRHGDNHRGGAGLNPPAPFFRPTQLTLFGHIGTLYNQRPWISPRSRI